MLGGGVVRNVRADQTSINEVRISWDPPVFVPPRGYNFRSDSLEIDVNISATSFNFSTMTPGYSTVKIQPLSYHYPGVTVTHTFLLQGER